MCSNVATKKICWSNHVQSDHSKDLSMVHVCSCVSVSYPWLSCSTRSSPSAPLTAQYEAQSYNFEAKKLRVCRSRHGGEHGKKYHQRKMCLEDDFNEITFTSLMHTPSVIYDFIVQADRARRLALQKELEETPWFATAWLPGHRKTQKTNETSRVCTCFLITEALGFPMPVLPLPTKELQRESEHGKQVRWAVSAVSVVFCLMDTMVTTTCDHPNGRNYDDPPGSLENMSPWLVAIKAPVDAHGSNFISRAHLMIVG